MFVSIPLFRCCTSCLLQRPDSSGCIVANTNDAVLRETAFKQCAHTQSRPCTEEYHLLRDSQLPKEQKSETIRRRWISTSPIPHHKKHSNKQRLAASQTRFTALQKHQTYICNYFSLGQLRLQKVTFEW